MGFVGLKERRTLCFGEACVSDVVAVWTGFVCVSSSVRSQTGALAGIEKGESEKYLEW